MATTQGSYVLELERTARKTVSTPVSFVGGYQFIWPLAVTDSTGWRRFGRSLAVGTLLGLWWIVVTIGWYAVLSSFFFFWIGWFVYTQSRRHRIRDARSTIAGRDQHIGSGALPDSGEL